METEKDFLEDTEAYVNVKARLKTAWELLSYANMMYKKVYVFKNFEKFSRSYTDPPAEEWWEGTHREKLIDHIKICIAFENYNKAILLHKGYLVHAIDPNKNKVLSKKQKIEPIRIEEFLNSNEFLQDQFTNEWYLDGLNNFKTITFSLTLSESYQHIIGIEQSFISYLKEINQKRNRLHYYKNYAGAFNFRVLLEKIAFAKSYGNSLIEAGLRNDELHDIY